MTQPPWPARLTQLVADQVRRYRKALGLSGQQLADRCASLGLDISRATITDLENGRRASITLAELLVLAAALDVPPLLLVVPLGLQEDIEILPRLTVSAWDAARWIDGDCKAIIEVTSEGPVLRDHRGPTAVDYFRAHDAVVAAWRKLIEHMTQALARGDDYGARTYRAAAEENIRELAKVRASMERVNLLLPPVPSDLLPAARPTVERPAQPEMEAE